MRLRTAKKIVNAINGPRESTYTGYQQRRALDRVSRTKSERDADVFWNDLLGNQLTVLDRAKILSSGAPSMAMGLLMRTVSVTGAKRRIRLRPYSNDSRTETDVSQQRLHWLAAGKPPIFERNQ